MPLPKMSCSIGGVTLNNPIIMASGTFGFGHEYAKLYDVGQLGGIATKGLTLLPRAGNAGNRIWETASGIMNSVGLENPGIEAFIKRELDAMANYQAAVIVNLGGGTLEDYVQGASMLQEADRMRKLEGRRGIDLLELNISCPNVKAGGIQFGVETTAARSIVRGVRGAAPELPLIVKLSPIARDLQEMAAMCEAEGADALSLINTIPSMKIDIHKRRSVFEQPYAGLSGPAIKPIALRLVHLAAKAVSIPVIGIGGITTAADVLEFIMAGAEAVQIGTANFVKLRIGDTIVSELQTLMQREHISSLDEIRGIV